MYGEGIISRLPSHSPLQQENNPFRNVFINTVGAILDDFDETESMEGVYLQSAETVYLDRHGAVLNVKRKLNESDEDYRQRLTYEVIGSITVKYLLEIYDLTLYVYVEDFDPSENTLTSDNPYINIYGFMAIADEETQNILANKFVIGDEITWFTL